MLSQNSIKKQENTLDRKDFKNYLDKIHSIGNLVLVSKKINSSKGDHSIKEGIDTILSYKDLGTSFKTTKDLAVSIKNKSYIWDFTDIDARTEKLCIESYNLFINDFHR